MLPVEVVQLLLEQQVLLQKELVVESEAGKGELGGLLCTKKGEMSEASGDQKGEQNALKRGGKRS